MRRTLLFILIAVSCALPVFADDQMHELQRGETIYTLARRYGVAADVILEYNGISDPTRLPVGAEIRIPGTYRVREGEYIYSIAAKLGVDWQELLRANGLSATDVVRPGDILFVPAGAVAPTASLDSTADATELSSDRAGPDSDAVNASSDRSNGDSSVADAVSTTPIVSRGLLMWPHPGQREAFDGRFKGISMLGEPGDEFRSVTSGVVQFVGPFTSFGKLILVRSENGYLYGYSGADRVDVELGERVSNGTVLGSVGVSPAFQSARVLFTVWRNNRYIDPEGAPRG